ncbi:DUF4190 domain-containing protein [Microbacterium sp. bgisy203]|uniref:DUF4190 domain-containing protein n=1 Tax=Microbacterium sp. bgisy203 TaxID=3413799 RepID=UPI003D74324E
MSDPQNPDSTPAAQPTPPAAPAQPAYGEYAQTPPPAQQQASAPAYSAPAYSAAPAYTDGSGSGSSYPGKTLGIVAFIVSFFFNIVGLILGIVAFVQSKKAGRTNGWAIAAIVIGAISVIITVILFFAVIVPSLNAATTCLNDPNATVTVWGVNIPCQQILEQSGR